MSVHDPVRSQSSVSNRPIPSVRSGERGFPVHYAFVALIIAGFAALRIATFDYPYVFDEYASLIFAEQPHSRLWSAWMTRETNPPLFYSLVRLWREAGFSGTDGMRLLAVLGGTLELVLLALAAKIGWGRRAMLPAVVLAGLSAQHIHYSQLLRAYIFAADFALLALIGLLLALRGQRIGYAVYSAGAALAIYAHTSMVILPAAASLAFMAVAGSDLKKDSWLAFRRLAIANLAALALAGWWLGVTVLQVLQGSGNVSWIKALPVKNFAWLLSQNVLLINEIEPGDHTLSKIVAVAGALAVLVTWRASLATRLMVLGAAMGAALLQLASLVHPIATEMTVFWLSVFTVLILAGGIARLKPQGLGMLVLAGLAAVLALNLVQRTPRMAHQDFPGALRAIAADPGAVLLVEHEAMGLISAAACREEYRGRTCPVRILTLASPNPGDSWSRGLLHPQPLSPPELERALGCCTRVYALRTYRYDPFLRLGLVKGPKRDNPTKPFFEGPVAAERIRAANWRMPDLKE